MSFPTSWQPTGLLQTSLFGLSMNFDLAGSGSILWPRTACMLGLGLLRQALHGFYSVLLSINLVSAQLEGPVILEMKWPHGCLPKIRIVRSYT